MSPYERYRHVAFTLDEFLKMVKASKEHFIGYCEIVITDNGLIFLASPSHMDVAEWLRKKGFKNFILVWYDGYVSYDKGNIMKLTKGQMKVLAALLDYGLISSLIDDITGHSDLGYGMDMDEEEWGKLLSRLRAEKERRTNGSHG